MQMQVRGTLQQLNLHVDKCLRSPRKGSLDAFVQRGAARPHPSSIVLSNLPGHTVTPGVAVGRSNPLLEGLESSSLHAQRRG